ncbi:MAG: Eco57I restriction-modification methylase domain-containing protein [Acidimicrobiia bacterium]
MPTRNPTTPLDLLAQVDLLRADATTALDQELRSDLGQFMTPLPAARLMASMLSNSRAEVRLLDPGAGSGSLTAAAVWELLAREEVPERIEAVAYEIEPTLVEYLARTLELCGAACELVGVGFEARVEATDFLTAAAEQSCLGQRPYNCAILNPPYRKIRVGSDARDACRVLGFEVSNLYAAFVGATVQVLEEGGELVAITPRSFANGPYFRDFRRFLLDSVSLRRLHVFDSRSRAFRDDDVLQENVILHALRASASPETVEITASEGPDAPVRARRVPWDRVVYRHDPEQFIHLIETDEGDAVAEQIRRFDNYLHDLGISVSTGPVVDFRAPAFLRAKPRDGTIPLLYPAHLSGGTVHWPRERAKWNALALTAESRRLTVPNGNYVLVKRFTAKEERRRVVAAVYEATAFTTERVGLENHLNFFHEHGRGLPLDLARGLVLYLNSTLVDTYFRQFSGHTQVNATDLRNIPYPTREHLTAAGRAVGTVALSQGQVDDAVERFFLR